jgi:flagellar hook protein FlgE
MALFGALLTGRSGLDTSGADLSVIGNNIANVSTIGFKGSRAEFADLLSANAGGETGKIGLGARVGAVRTLFTQGAIESTGRALDLAIQGEGFFVLREGQGKLFTRAGNFQESPTGEITDLLGHPLQGTPLNADGTNAGGVTDVVVAGVSSQAKATSRATLVANLQADAPVPSPFDEVTPDFQSAFSDQSNYFTNIQIFDFLGKSHNLTLFFSRVGANTWEVHAGVDAGETGGTPGDLQLLDLNGGTAGLAATVTFDSGGKVASTNPATISGSVTFSGAAAQPITLDLSGLTQFASPSAAGFVNQDGFGAGGLTALDVDAKGILSATFDNGQTRPLFQLAIAKFTAPEGLTPIGNQLYRESISSGPPAVATAQTSGNGSVVSSSLEQSNVAIAQEFISLISAQRAFQANSRVITASDTLLNDLINIIR